ncbi:13128_t:CDS:2, partial [Racocetra fulgida]
AGKASTKKNVSSDNINSEETPIETIFIEEISNHIADLISGLEHNEMLSSTFCVKLDEAMLSTIAPNLSTHYQGVGNAYFVCSQSDELKYEYKESNHIRINHFNCGDKLNINIDISAKEAKVVLKHKLIYDILVDITTPPEIKQEIIDNLNMDPIHLRIHLRKKFDINETHKKLQTEALEGFFRTLYNKGLHPIYFYTDKDFMEINTAKNVWPFKEVLNEFSFVDSSFKPDLQHEDKEYYVVCSSNLHRNVIGFVKIYKIPVNSNSSFLSPTEIRNIAVQE